MDTRSIYTGTQSAARDTNKVLRNTYMLLSLTLGFSAVVAGVATVMNMPPLHWAIFLVGVYGLMFLTEKNRDNGMGLVFTFALTGLLGYSLGPIINMYMNNGGGEIVMTALGGTALTFFGLSAYALTTKRDLSFIGGMLFVGFWVLLVAMIAAIALTLRSRKESKAINPAVQVRVRAADRMQVVKMAVTQKAPESTPVVPEKSSTGDPVQGSPVAHYA